MSRARAEGLAVSRSPELLRGSLVEMSAGDGGLAQAGIGFVDAWGQSLQDVVRDLGRLADGLRAVGELYGAVEKANTLTALVGPHLVTGAGS